MDYKFLHRVIDQIVSETKIDFDKEVVYFPFFVSPFLLLSSPSSFPSLYLSSFSFSFSKYCKNIYGLTDDEVGYVFEEYKDIIKDKIENG